MLTPKELQRRMKITAQSGVPIVNYGIAIAKMNGILERSIDVFSKKTK